MKFEFHNLGHGFLTEFNYSKQKITTQKTDLKILEIINSNSKISRKEIAEILGDISESGVKYHLNKLVKKKS
jgi:predicted HTH transcriptional regulator